jgi:hypothetical protein
VDIHFVCKTKDGSIPISGLEKPVILSTFFIYRRETIHANEILAAISEAQRIHTHNTSNYFLIISKISHRKMRKCYTHLNVSGIEPTVPAIEIFLQPFETKWYPIWKYNHPIDFLVDQLERVNSSPA